MKLATSYGYPICFLGSAIALWAGVHYQTNWTLLAAVTLFLIWDVYFFCSSDSFVGRDATFTIQQVVQARSYISYFIPFYGILFGVLLATNVDAQKFF